MLHMKIGNKSGGRGRKRGTCGTQMLKRSFFERGRLSETLMHYWWLKLSSLALERFVNYS